MLIIIWVTNIESILRLITGLNLCRRSLSEMSELGYYKWWRRHFRPRYPKIEIIRRLTGKLWVHYNDIRMVHERIDRAIGQF